MTDNVAVTAGSGTTIATDDVAGVHYQRVKLVNGTLDATDAIPGDATNGLDVDVTRLPALVTGSAVIGKVGIDTTTPGTTNLVAANGVIAHDGVNNAGNPILLGAEAASLGVTPTSVAAGDMTKLYATRGGSLFVLGGHPNTQTIKHTTITTAVTNAAIITVSAGTRIVVTAFTVTLDNASTVFPSVLIGFATATTPTTSQVIGSHGGVPAGGGFSRGDGSGILGIGADDEDLRVTTVGNATGNGLHIVVTYYTTAV